MTTTPNLRVIDSNERIQPTLRQLSRPPELPSSLYAALVAVDICSFGKRDDHIQMHQRRQLYARMVEAFEITQIPWAECYKEDRGDGVLLVVQPGVPVHYLLDPLAHHLTAVLRRCNRLASASARLQLRLAVHVGYIHRDDHGVAGSPLVHLFRLLEATKFKQALAGTDADLGLIVSDRLYTDAAEHGGLIDSEAYHPMQVICKETTSTARIWFPPGHNPGGI